jgi:hippurate hydrolase
MQIIHDRRALHRIPELDRDLPKTLSYLQSGLEKLNCRVFSPMPGALCAYFDFGAKDAIAFRSDADALPIRENTGAEFASAHPGRMHACGHDGHMAILLELARRLNEKEKLPHNVLLVFQPAEETTGGAKELCATGVFKEYHVKAIFGLHLWPGLTAGEIFSRRQEMMSRSCEVKVEILGKSAHIALVQRRLDLVQKTEGGRLQALDREEEGDRRQSFLSARELHHILEFLARRLRDHPHTCLQNVHVLH